MRPFIIRRPDGTMQPLTIKQRILARQLLRLPKPLRKRPVESKPAG